MNIMPKKVHNITSLPTRTLSLKATAIILAGAGAAAIVAMVLISKDSTDNA